MNGVVRASAAEGIGTALLLATIVGSGIMGELLAGGNVALALLANSLATGFGLFALIVAFASVSGAHFNPLVSVAAAIQKTLPGRRAAAYIAAQFGGAVLGVALAHAMFDLPLVGAYQSNRTGSGQWIAEGMATFGLLITIRGSARYGVPAVAAAVGAYIAAAYWFTASTSFANPAVTIARALTSTFAGIRMSDAPGFIVAQCLGAGAAVVLGHWIFSNRA